MQEHSWWQQESATVWTLGVLLVRVLLHHMLLEDGPREEHLPAVQSGTSPAVMLLTQVREQNMLRGFLIVAVIAVIRLHVVMSFSVQL